MMLYLFQMRKMFNANGCLHRTYYYMTHLVFPQTPVYYNWVPQVILTFWLKFWNFFQKDKEYFFNIFFLISLEGKWGVEIIQFVKFILVFKNFCIDFLVCILHFLLSSFFVLSKKLVCLSYNSNNWWLWINIPRTKK